MQNECMRVNYTNASSMEGCMRRIHASAGVMRVFEFSLVRVTSQCDSLSQHLFLYDKLLAREVHFCAHTFVIWKAQEKI